MPKSKTLSQSQFRQRIDFLNFYYQNKYLKSFVFKEIDSELTLFPEK